jgi:hypothetical protein
MPTADYYRDEAARCRDLASLEADRHLAVRLREVAVEYDQVAERLAAEMVAFDVGPMTMQQQPRQQQQTRSGPPEAGQLSLAKQIRPACISCGQPAWLVRIEPAPEPDHDLRTFECSICEATQTVKVKFR